MRVLVAGKGGVGKTTIVTALAAALREAGTEVVAVDADSNPNLALRLGAGDPDTLPAVVNDAPAKPAHRHDEDGHDEPHGEEFVAQFGVEADGGFPLVQTGRLERPSAQCLCCGSHRTARKVLAALPAETERLVLGDLEAGLNGCLWAKPQPGDTLIVVTDASRKAREVAVRLLTAARELGVTHTVVVANKLRDDELDAVRMDFGAHSLVELAYNPALGDGSPNTDGMEGLGRVLDRLFG